MTDQTKPEVKKVCVGYLVRNAKMPLWGPGRILAIDGLTATVYFRDAAEARAGDAVKNIDLRSGALEILPSQSDPLLDNLPPYIDGKLEIKKPRLTLAQSIAAFSARFPGGFEDPAYLGDRIVGERTYKWEAYILWTRTLGKSRGRSLLNEGRLEEVVKHALAVDGHLNLLSIYEKMALRDGLKDQQAATRYFHALFDLLEADLKSREKFEAYVESLLQLPAEEGKAPVARWPVLTLFPFIARPDRFMFLKPEVTKDCADRLAFNLGYSPALNWTTYDRLLTMCSLLMEHLRPLGARDMIDVQSFIWLIGTLD